MSDNTILNGVSVAGGDTVRNVEKSLKKTQVVILDLGGAGAENLVTGFIPTKITNGTTTADVSASNELLVSFKDMVPAVQSITAQDVASTVTTGSNNQSIITGTPTAGSVATLTISGDTSFSVSVLGTWTGTLQFERSLDAGVTYTPIGAFAAGTSFAPQTTTLNGNFHGNASSATTIRVRSTAAFTGTASIKLLAGAGVGTITVGNGIRLFDKVSGVEHTIKAASTLPLATDTAMVVAVRDAVAVTGAFYQATQPVSGTFFQATQPVSATSLPLPTGASTETTLSALNTKVTAVNTGAVTISSALPAGANAIGTVAINAAIPAGTNAIGTVTAVGGAGQGQAISGNPIAAAAAVNNAGGFVTTNATISRLVMSTGGQLLTKPYGLPELDWQYAGATGGIINTTDVVVKAAGAAGIRNYVTGINVQNNSATATEVVLKDGATTVIWRGLLAANTSPLSTIDVTFPTPLRGTAATALNVACITTGAAVYFNAQGYAAP